MQKEETPRQTDDRKQSATNQPPERISKNVSDHLANFLRTRRAIDEQRFRPPATFAIVLTVLACMVGLLLAVYLLFTS
jgi:hypothetical protein